MALCNGPHINNPTVDAPRAAAAWEALGKARALAAGASPIEKALIEALGRRYPSPQPANRAPLDEAYAAAMREVWTRYPDDADLGALFAEAMMDLGPWHLWTKDGRPEPGTDEIVSTLDRVMTIAPDHPGALHLYIHAVEASPAPGRAIVAADRLRRLVPGSGHLVHMPSHIDTLVGRWAEAVVSNQEAIRSDRAYRARSPRQGFYRVYMAHNSHMLAYAAMMDGQSVVALQAAREMVASMPEDHKKENPLLVDGMLSTPIDVLMRFGRWEEVLGEPKPADFLPVSNTRYHFARGAAFAATGRLAEAGKERRDFEKAFEEIPEETVITFNSARKVLDIARDMLAGEIAFRKGMPDEAVAKLRSAVAKEDALDYMEPADWIQPNRHSLGALLLELGRASEAEAVYREDLLRRPGNGWSLYGLSRALRLRGQNEQADQVTKRFERAWERADVKIHASCLCLKGRETPAGIPGLTCSVPARSEARADVPEDGTLQLEEAGVAVCDAVAATDRHLDLGAGRARRMIDALAGDGRLAGGIHAAAEMVRRAVGVVLTESPARLVVLEADRRLDSRRHDDLIGIGDDCQRTRRPVLQNLDGRLPVRPRDAADPNRGAARGLVPEQNDDHGLLSEPDGGKRRRGSPARRVERPEIPPGTPVVDLQLGAREVGEAGSVAADISAPGRLFATLPRAVLPDVRESVQQHRIYSARRRGTVRGRVASAMPTHDDDADFDVHCEWGEQGLRAMLPVSDVVIIVDVLLFSTCVDIAVGRGAAVLPYQWKDESARTFAGQNQARLAGPRGQGGFSLSPGSFLEVTPGARIVLPSPNGGALSLRTDDRISVTGCLRNAAAVARAADRLGRRITVIAAGEQWPDGSLRPALEDWLGAGAIIAHLTGRRSPEAGAAADLYRISLDDIEQTIRACVSGQELIGRGFEQDVELAAQLNVSDAVPVLGNGVYESWCQPD